MYQQVSMRKMMHPDARRVKAAVEWTDAFAHLRDLEHHSD